MNASGATAGWSRRRWGLTIAVVFLAQLLASFALSDRASPTSVLRASLERFSLVPDRRTASQLADQPWLADPAAAVLASPHGFTGRLWREQRAAKPNLAEWREPPRWLRAETGQLGLGFAPAGLPVQALIQVADRPRPIYHATLVNPQSMATNSTLVVGGELAGRSLAGELSLPVWPHTDILQPTTLAVLVNDHGAVLSTTLLAGSGLAAADQKAQELALSARFASVPAAQRQGPLTWGRLVFRWVTVPLVETVGKAPPP